MIFEEKSKKIITQPVYHGPFIYFLLLNNEVVYVGKTAKGIARPFQHHDKTYNLVKLLPYAEEELEIIENYYILKYRPKYNKTIDATEKFKLCKGRNILRRALKMPQLSILEIKKVAIICGAKIEKIDGVSYFTYENFLKVYLYLKRCEDDNRKCNC